MFSAWSAICSPPTCAIGRRGERAEQIAARQPRTRVRALADLSRRRAGAAGQPLLGPEDRAMSARRTGRGKALRRERARWVRRSLVTARLFGQGSAARYDAPRSRERSLEGAMAAGCRVCRRVHARRRSRSTRLAPGDGSRRAQAAPTPRAQRAGPGRVQSCASCALRQRVRIGWQPRARGEHPLAGYRIERDGAVVGQTHGLTTCCALSAGARTA